MDEPITIKKKKKLTIKSKSANAEPPNTTPDLGSVIPGLSAPVVEVFEKTPSYTIYAILAIITALMFMAILALQWTEWTYLLPAFPRPIPTGV